MCLAIPGRIMSVTEDDPVIRMGRVDFGGVMKEIHLAFVPEVRVGDYVLVHAGFALTVIDEEAAQRTLAYLHEATALTPERAETSP